jgi:putative phosphoesterase
MPKRKEITVTRKIVVFSDSHGNSAPMRKALDMHKDADLIVHLGDGASYLSNLMPDTPPVPLILIEGNGEYFGWVRVDRRFRPQKYAMTEFEGKKIFMTHGHLYDVKYDLERLAARAYADGADIVLFGHTHFPLCRYYPAGSYFTGVGETNRDLLLFNPGSIGKGMPLSYGILTFNWNDVLPSHGTIR